VGRRRGVTVGRPPRGASVAPTSTATDHDDDDRRRRHTDEIGLDHHDDDDRLHATERGSAWAGRWDRLRADLEDYRC
jgi:hypothetical protein